MLKDLKGKTVYDLDRSEFEALFCRQCRDCGRCAKDSKTIGICQHLIDSGVWDIVFRRRLGS